MKTTKEKIEVMQWYENGNTVRYSGADYNMAKDGDLIWDWYNDTYNKVIEQVYVPYTAEDIDNLEPSQRYVKSEENRYAIVSWNNTIIMYVSNSGQVYDITYEELLKRTTHLDGSKCGKVKE